MTSILIRGIRVDVIALILIAVSLGAFGQLFMKMGMSAVGQVSITQIVGEKFAEIATNRFVIAGVLAYVFSLGLWLAVLSKAELSLAFPLVGLSYVIVAILSSVFLHENLTTFRILGIGLIVAGAFVLLRFS